MRPAVGVWKPAMARKQGGLAGSGGAQDREELPVQDVEVEGTDGFELAEPDREPADSEKWRLAVRGRPRTVDLRVAHGRSPHPG